MVFPGGQGGEEGMGFQSMFWESGAPPATLGGSRCGVAGARGCSGPLLPPPDWPTRATILPGGSVRLKSLSTGKPGRQG